MRGIQTDRSQRRSLRRSVLSGSVGDLSDLALAWHLFQTQNQCKQCKLVERRRPRHLLNAFNMCQFSFSNLRHKPERRRTPTRAGEKPHTRGPWPAVLVHKLPHSTFFRCSCWEGGRTTLNTKSRWELGCPARQVAYCCCQESKT